MGGTRFQGSALVARKGGSGGEYAKKCCLTKNKQDKGNPPVGLNHQTP